MFIDVCNTIAHFNPKNNANFLKKNLFSRKEYSQSFHDYNMKLDRMKFFGVYVFLAQVAEIKAGSDERRLKAISIVKNRSDDLVFSKFGLYDTTNGSVIQIIKKPFEKYFSDIPNIDDYKSDDHPDFSF
jgi:hypothetical protein